MKTFADIADAVLVGAGVLWLVLRLSPWGFHRRTRSRAAYVHDPALLALSPALVGYYWRDGITKSVDAAATLLDLIRRGVVRLATEETPAVPGGKAGTGHVRALTLVPDAGDDLQAHEAVVLALVFDIVAGGKKTVPAHAIDEFAREDHDVFVRGLAAFCRVVDAEAEQRAGLRGHRSFWAATRVAVSGLTVVLGSLLLFALSMAPLCILGAVVGGIMITVSYALGQPTGKAAEIRERAEGLRCYIEDFGAFADRPVEQLALWDQYLVYAVVFGLDHVAAHNVWARNAFDLAESEATDPMWWQFMGPGDDPRLHSVRTIVGEVVPWAAGVDEEGAAVDVNPLTELAAAVADEVRQR